MMPCQSEKYCFWCVSFQMIHPISEDPCSTIQLQHPTLVAFNVTDVPVLSEAHVQDTFHRSSQSVQEMYRNGQVADDSSHRFRRSLDDLEISRNLVLSTSSDGVRDQMDAMDTMLTVLPQKDQNIVQLINLDVAKDSLSNQSLSNLLYLLKTEIYNEGNDHKQMGEQLNSSIWKQMQKQLYSMFVQTSRRSKRSVSDHDMKRIPKDSSVDKRSIMQLYRELLPHFKNSKESVMSNRVRRESNGENTVDSSTTVKNYNVASADPTTVSNSAVSGTNSARKNVLDTTTQKLPSDSGTKVTTASPKKPTLHNKVGIVA